MPKISLIATDLDGTLFYDRENIAPADREALRRVHAAGVLVSLATGREFSAVTPALDRLELWPYIHYVIHSGGSYVYDAAAKKHIALGVLSVETMRDLYDRYVGEGLCMLLPADGKLYVNRVCDGLRREAEVLSSPLEEVPDLKTAIHAPNGKVNFYGPAEALDRFYPRIAADPDPRFTPFRSHENYIDCYAAGVNKGTALTHLCALTGVPVSEAAAIGDNHNDLDLLAAAGFSACPGDGAPDARAAADYVCCDARDGAFADFCRWLGI